MFNAFNTVSINARVGQLQLNSPTDLTIRNNQFLADGTLNPAQTKTERCRLRRGKGRVGHADGAVAVAVPVLRTIRTGE